MIRFLMGLFSKRCPYYRSIEFRTVGIRNSMEGAIYWLLHPFRCSMCGHHFFLFRWQIPVGGTA
jgi:hypothetical protein